MSELRYINYPYTSLCRHMNNDCHDSLRGACTFTKLAPVQLLETVIFQGTLWGVAVALFYVSVSVLSVDLVQAIIPLKSPEVAI